MTLEDLGRAVHMARNGKNIVFVTKAPAQWLLGFIEVVSDPSNIMRSMRKAQWQKGSIIITNQIDPIRLAGTDRVVIHDEDCPLEEYAAYLAKQKGVSTV